MIVAENMPNACLKRTAPIYIFVIFVALCAFAVVGFAGEIAPSHLAAEVSNITYRNNDEYLMEITVANRSGGDLDLEGYEAIFSAQSEVIGRWIELDRRMAGGSRRNAGLSIAGEGKWKANEIVTLPLAVPHLFRNHEGDVNVRFKYKLTFTGAGPPGERKESGESAYWVTPRTNRWVLREGM
jgi:hypothetical protein